MPSEDELSYLCAKKYQLLVKLRETGLTEGEATDLSEIESRIRHIQMYQREGEKENPGPFDLLEARVTTALKKFS